MRNVDLAVDFRARKAVSNVLERAGFKKLGRMWMREELDLYIEMLGDIAQIDMDKVTRVETDAGSAYIIGVEDIIFDIVQTAKHWNSKADEDQAVRMGAVYYGEIDWEYLEKKCKEEDSKDTLEAVKRRIKNERNKTF